MKEFVVNSKILPTSMDSLACAKGISEMLKKQGISDVKIKSCYCCGAMAESLPWLRHLTQNLS